MNRPKPQEQSSWSSKYTDLVDGDVLQLLETQASEFPNFILSIRHLEEYRYAPNKWTIKEMFGHIIDTERILVYRLLCFARNEQQALPGFEEDDYVKETDFSKRSLNDLSAEFMTLRMANMYLFRSLGEDKLDKIGTSWQSKLSVRTLIYVCAGHVLHHTNVIKERYL